MKSVMRPTKNATVMLTTMCTWECPYCDIPGLSANEATIAPLDNIREWLPKICDAHPRVSFTGGEVGTLGSEALDAAFDCLQSPVNINTNGLFIKRGFYDKYKSLIRSVTLHCSQDLRPDDFSMVLDDGTPGKNVIVVTRSNIKRLKPFLKRYEAYRFEVRLFEPKRLDESEALHILTKDDIRSVAETATESVSNVTNAEALWNVHDNFDKQSSFVNICKDRVTMYDLTRMRAYGCCKSASYDSRRITDEAILKGQVTIDERGCRRCLTCLEKDEGRAARDVLRVLFSATRMAMPRGQI